MTINGPRLFAPSSFFLIFLPPGTANTLVNRPVSFLAQFAAVIYAQAAGALLAVMHTRAAGAPPLPAVLFFFGPLLQATERAITLFRMVFAHKLVFLIVGLLALYAALVHALACVAPLGLSAMNFRKINLETNMRLFCFGYPPGVEI